MAKNLLKGMAALAICAAFASCSKDADFESAHQELVAENLKKEYKIAFEQKYGAIDPNQTWDFADPYEGGSTVTRFELNTNRTPQSTYTTPSGIVMKEYTLGSGQGVINNHKSKIQQKLNSGDYTTKLWDTDVNVFNIFACFVTGPQEDKINSYYMKIGVHSVGLDGKEYNTCILGNGSGYQSVKGSYMNTAYANAYYSVDVTGMKASSSDYYWYCIATASTNDDPNAENDILDDDARLIDFREVVVSGVTYWCFDSNHEGSYTGIICQVTPALYGKRYMIEDLGSIGDFDFNDIVVDVYETYEGQKAVIRALGGTYNFTLKIGDTEWSKSPTYVSTEMKNTLGTINYDEELQVIDISGWKPTENNISIEVVKEGETKSKDVYTITFPKAGEAPMIIAVDPVKRWMNEYVSVPQDWWY